ALRAETRGDRLDEPSDEGRESAAQSEGLCLQVHAVLALDEPVEHLRAPQVAAVAAGWQELFVAADGIFGFTYLVGRRNRIDAVLVRRDVADGRTYLKHRRDTYLAFLQ